MSDFFNQRYERMRETKNDISIFLPKHLETWSWHLVSWRMFTEGIGSLVLDTSLRCQLDFYVEMQSRPLYMNI